MNIEPYITRLNPQFDELDKNEEMIRDIIGILLAFKTKSEALNNKLLLLEERIRKCMEKGKMKTSDKLVQQLMEKFGQIEGLNDLIQDLQKGEISPEEMVQIASSTILDLEQEVQRLRQEVSRGEENLKIRTEKFDEEGKLLYQFNREKEELNQKIDEINEKMMKMDSTTESENEDISSDIINLVAKFLALLNQLQDKEIQIYPQEVATNELKKVNDAVENLKRQQKYGLDDLKLLNQELVDNQNNLIKIQQEIEKLKRQKFADEEELTKLSQLSEDLKYDIGQVKTEIQDLKDELQLSDDELQLLLQQKSTLEKLKKKPAPKPIGKEELEEQYMEMEQLSRRLLDLGIEDEVRERVEQIVNDSLEKGVKDVVDGIIKGIQVKLNEHIFQMRSLMERLKQDFSDPDTLSIYQMERKVDELLGMLEDCEKTTESLSQLSQQSTQETIEKLQEALENCKLNYLELKLYKEQYPTDKIFERVQDYDYVLDETDFNNVRDQCEKIEMGLRLAKVKYQ